MQQLTFTEENYLKALYNIANEAGEVNVAELYKSIDIKNIKGLIYNAQGKPVGKFSKSDFKDTYAGGDESLFEDMRVKYYLPAVTEYPYTIEYEYDKQEKQTLDFDNWTPNSSEGVSVEKSVFTFTCYPEFKINYKEFNVPQKVETGTDKNGRITYTWQASHLKAIKAEPYSPNYENYLTMVKIAPVKFSYDGFNGAFNNWNDLGKWIYDDLLKDRDIIPDETAAYIKQLIANIADPKEKARKIYEYMQSKTRYVSVQVGIGGVRPFLAADVDKTGYGDCKALVNYTRGLLKIAGIESWYCVVYGDSRKINITSNFTSMQGNHIILCIPFKKDTTWLECTSQQIPFGFLGDFTDDRTTLACTPEGGKLLHTPKYTAENNLVKRTGDFLIDDKGKLSGQMITGFNGTDYNDRDGLMHEAYKDQLKYIKEIYPIDGLEVNKLSFEKSLKTLPAITEHVKLDAYEFAALNATKYYFKPNLANRTHHIPDEVRNRKNEVYINRGYSEQDSISYTLPPNYQPQGLLINKIINKPFGSYNMSIASNNGKLIYKRYFKINDGTFSKETYQDMIDFFIAVAELDNYKVALVKNN